MPRRGIFGMVLAAVLATTSATFAVEQDSQSPIQARELPEALLLDLSGAPIPYAQILVESQPGMAIMHRTTDEAGHVRLSDLAPGTYVLTVLSPPGKRLTNSLAFPEGHLLSVRLTQRGASLVSFSCPTCGGTFMGGAVAELQLETSSLEGLIPEPTPTPTPQRKPQRNRLERFFSSLGHKLGF